MSLPLLSWTCKVGATGVAEIRDDEYLTVMGVHDTPRPHTSKLAGFRYVLYASGLMDPGLRVRYLGTWLRDCRKHPLILSYIRQTVSVRSILHQPQIPARLIDIIRQLDDSYSRLQDLFQSIPTILLVDPPRTTASR
jgi:hypothetical protein